MMRWKVLFAAVATCFALVGCGSTGTTGSEGSGGATGSGGVTGTGGATGTGGSTGTGGATNTGGVTGTGGATGTGGITGTAGTTGGAGRGGTNGTGGTGGTTGAAGHGGTTGTGGTTTAARPDAAARRAPGGTTGAAGHGGTTGTGGHAGYRRLRYRRRRGDGRLLGGDADRRDRAHRHQRQRDGRRPRLRHLDQRERRQHHHLLQRSRVFYVLEQQPGFPGSPRPGFQQLAKAYTAYGTIAAQFVEKKSGSGGGFSSIGMYGWTHSPCVEWYINEDSYNGLGGGGSATAVIDGATYHLQTKTTTGTGGANACESGHTGGWTQMISTRSSARTCGTITVSDHFAAWTKQGWSLGTLSSVHINVEVGGGQRNHRLPGRQRHDHQQVDTSVDAPRSRPPYAQRWRRAP